jgi:hypothetical protein
VKAAEEISNRPAGSQAVVIAGDDLPRLMSLAAGIRSAFSVTWTIETNRPIERLLDLAAPPAAVVLYLTGRENVADIRFLAARFPSTAFIFMSREWPPHAAMARAAAVGGVVLRRNESAIVVSAALISLLAQGRAASA